MNRNSTNEHRRVFTIFNLKKIKRIPLNSNVKY